MSEVEAKIGKVKDLLDSLELEIKTCRQILKGEVNG